MGAMNMHYRHRLFDSDTAPTTLLLTDDGNENGNNSPAGPRFQTYPDMVEQYAEQKYPIELWGITPNSIYYQLCKTYRSTFTVHKLRDSSIVRAEYRPVPAALRELSLQTQPDVQAEPLQSQSPMSDPHDCDRYSVEDEEDAAPNTMVAPALRPSQKSSLLHWRAVQAPYREHFLFCNWNEYIKQWRKNFRSDDHDSASGKKKNGNSFKPDMTPLLSLCAVNAGGIKVDTIYSVW
jgi:hypothetical protein